jgi:hypothetical protein
MAIEAILDMPPRPYIFSKHQNFFNFSEFYPETPGIQPLYISFVRHPVDRVISWYYYIRNPLYLISDDVQSDLSVKQIKNSIEECIHLGRNECFWPKGSRIHNGRIGGSHKSQLSFFCGHHPECDLYDSDALFSRALEVSERTPKQAHSKASALQS